MGKEIKYKQARELLSDLDDEMNSFKEGITNFQVNHKDLIAFVEKQFENQKYTPEQYKQIAILLYVEFFLAFVEKEKDEFVRSHAMLN